jgi:dihydroorotase (multifunctional complex type)
MEKLNLLIKGGKVFLNRKFAEANIAIKDEKIHSITDLGAPLPPADRTIDAQGKQVLPGLIDTHVHMREPGFTHKEDITSATQAAAAGGVTLAVDMPNVKPSTNSYERTVEHKALAATKAVVDFNHWIGPPADLTEVDKIISEGVIGIKVFMMNDTKRSYPHMPELGILSYGHLYEIFQACAASNAVCAVHPHSQELFEWIEKRYFWEKGLTKPEDYAHALRYGDSIVYDTAFAALFILARSAKVKLNLLHLNTYLGTRMAEWYYNDGVDLSCEMNPPHFFITMEDVKKRGPYVLGSWTPPKDQDALWKVVQSESLPFPAFWGTDHAPHHIDEKEIGWKDMWKAHGGAPYVQDYLSLFLNAASQGRITLERIVELGCEVPAKRFGFYPRKGVIQVGSDADFVIVDLNKERTITKKQNYSRAGYNPFEGWKVKGVPVHTIVRGTVVMEEEKVVGKPGFGQFIPAER